jgi:hypothetical protein
MTLFFSLAFGAGVAAWAYSKLGRRLGYGNSQSVWTLVSVIFVLTSIVFYTVLWTLGLN